MQLLQQLHRWNIVSNRAVSLGHLATLAIYFFIADCMEHLARKANKPFDLENVKSQLCKAD